MATTWNPADETGVTFSDTNHTITSTSGGNVGARGTTSHSSGKWYLEYSNIQLASSFGGGKYGFGLASDALGSSGQFYVADLSGGLGGTNAAASGSLGGSVQGHTLCFAVDLVNQAFWARYDNGSWVGDGTAGADPATNAHGRSLVGISAGALFPYAHIQNGGGTATITINAGDSAFLQAVPAGFAAWDGTQPLQPSHRALIIG